ncbi:MAG: efflux RND transporter periplasmic adaptor subunit [Gemmatimonadetes bacterium]|jgi:membrane fusion protein, multidrug efflux system|nr:efflux RND transporter periplasmic adaptor subunit [Gemmatimonadota bacterium]
MNGRLMRRVVFSGLCVALWNCGDSQEEGEQGEEGAAGADSTLADSTLADSTLADSTLADSAAADSVKQKKIDAIPVETMLARQGVISSYLLFNSTVETEAAVEIYPQISGLVERIVAEEGDRVEEGDTLLFIDDDQLRLAAEEAEVNFVHLEKGFERTEEMSRRKLISKQEFENKRYEMDQARLRRERAKLELEHSIIRVPFSGVITERHVQVGARVGPSSNLFSLIKLDDMITRVFVPGQYLMAISADQEAMITSDFLQGKRFEGWVKRISPVVDPKSGTFKVTVGVRDRWEFMRPGIFVNVQIITDTHEEAVLIPKQAIVYDGGDRFVFAVRDSMASRVKLDGGFEDGESIEALASIEPGTPIIIVGQNGLKDQAKVKIVNADSSVAEGDGEAVVDEADKE